MSQFGFFDVGAFYRRLDSLGDRLARMDALIDWTGLRAIMDRVTFRKDEKGIAIARSHEGRPPREGLMMGKILILQAKYNLSDQQTEFLLNDRLSFRRFVGLTDPSALAPHWTTIRNWRERLIDQNLLDPIFKWFDEYLNKEGYEAKGGQIVDATFVPTHKPTGKHKKQLEKKIPLKPAQERQIDKDATFTKKGNQTYHGYKNGVNIDVTYKLIRTYEVTTASVHDSQMIEALVQDVPGCPKENPVASEPVASDIVAMESALWEPLAKEEVVVLGAPEGEKEGEKPLSQDDDFFGDSAFRSKEIEQLLQSKGLVSQVHERAYKDKPLTEAQEKENHRKSKVRVRVEHVFGHMETAMNGMMIHTLGLARAKAKMMFKNLTYNIERFVCLRLKNEKPSLKTQPKCA
jgi:transposase, IS5 family